MFQTREHKMPGYVGYRGRSGGSVKKWLVLLLTLVLLASAAFLFVQRYRVYREDGTSYLELPYLSHIGAASGASLRIGE